MPGVTDIIPARYQRWGKTAETIAHGVRGKDYNSIQNAASHAFGYAFAPFEMAMEDIVPAVTRLTGGRKSRAAATRTSNLSHKNTQILPKMSTRKGKYKPTPRERALRAALIRRRQTTKPKQAKKIPTSRRPVFQNARRGRGRRAVQVGARSAFVQRRMTAPVRYGAVRNSSNRITFRAGSKPGCMVIEGKIMYGPLVAADQAGGQVCVFAVRSGGLRAEISEMPQNAAYFDSPVYLMSQLFNRFRIKTRLHYIGASGTTQTGNVLFAYFDDPVAFFSMSGRDFEPDNNPTATELRGCPTLKEGSVWSEFMTGWSDWAPGDDMNYVAATTFSQFINPDFSNIAGFTQATDNRQQSGGQWVFAGSSIPSPGEGKTTTLGDLWVEYKLELCDLVTNPMQNPTSDVGLLSLRKPIKSAMTDMVKEYHQRKREEKSDEPPSLFKLAYERALHEHKAGEALSSLQHTMKKKSSSTKSEGKTPSE